MTLFGALDDVGVVAAAQTPVTGNGEQGDRADVAVLEQRCVGGLELHAGLEILQNASKTIGERTATQNLFLGPADLGGCHEAHGLGDLPGVFNGTDPVADLLQVGHGLDSPG